VGPNHAASTIPKVSSKTQSSPPLASCTDGTATVQWQSDAPVTTACAHVGSTLVLAGGYAGSGGSWPGPAVISDPAVLAKATTAPSTAPFSVTVRATSTGTATVSVPFVAGSEACHPTPCTPIPGRPLVWEITVVS
jgi:hypothetical protein